MTDRTDKEMIDHLVKMILGTEDRLGLADCMDTYYYVCFSEDIEELERLYCEENTDE